ncbi:protein-tyrosine-phosphatase [Kibdelosporangium banguiense]|uniref:Protein-tyrosine-phosphatase n=1 Tax=Kibdelosporangium banguiense TaxID=1365924 RepID=A0ABS4TK65_9PSEU|nr:ATP-binding protein [Kibdelosporangium banguiense]MBP2324795.1 protein-tyrosine-phosphatase [Kibdelosporangium banguiense]
MIRAEIAAATAAFATAGIGGADALAELTGFLNAPPTVLVAGLKGTGKTRVVHALAETMPDVVVVERGLHDVPALWDVLVLLTPADRVLSQAEESLVRQARNRGQVVTVLVTRADLFGADRDSAVDEIERLRLAPRLRPLGVRWRFAGREDNIAGLGVRDLLGTDREAGHEPAVRAAFREILDSAVTQLSARVPTRDEERAALAEAGAQLSLVESALSALPASAATRVADRLLTAETRVQEAAHATVPQAVVWVSAMGVGPWEPVMSSLREAWSDLQRTTADVVELEREHFQQEVGRLSTKIRSVAAALAISLTGEHKPQPQWNATDAPDADFVASMDLDGVEHALKQICQAEVDRLAKTQAEGQQDWKIDPARLRPKRDPAGQEKQKPGRAIKRRLRDLGGELRQYGERFVTEADSLLAPKFVDNVSHELVSAVDRLLGVRYAALVVGLRNIVRRAALAESTAAAEVLRSHVDDMAAELSDRHAWSAGYDEILRVRQRIGGESAEPV